MAGYPVKRHGPYVKVPFFTSRKRQYTTVEAFERFIRVAAELEAESGVRDIDLSGLEPPKKKRKKKGQ